MKTKSHISLALLAAMPMILQTSMSASEPVVLPAINIIGDTKILDDIPGSGEIIDSKKLEQTQPLSTQDALRRIAGVHVVDTEGYGFYPRITIRGIGSDMSKKVLLLEDGAPIALGPYTDPAAYYSPPIERMDSIEVLKGSGSLAFGPSTIGGAINYITRNPEGGRIKVSGGTDNYRNMLAEYGGTWGDTTASVSVLHKQGDGWRDMPFEITDVVLKAGTAIDNKNFVGIKLTRFDQEATHTYLGLTEKEYEQNYQQNKAQNDKMYVKRDSIDLNHEYDFGSGSWKTLAYWNTATRDWWRENFTFNAGTGVNGLTGQEQGRLREFDVMGIDSRVTFAHETFGIKNDTELGIRFHTEEMVNRRTNNAPAGSHTITSPLREDDTRKADAIALFAQNKFHVTDTTTITPGVRVESYEQTRDIRTWDSVAKGTTTKTDNTEIIPGLGATHQLNSATTLFAGVHKGFAPATVADAVGNDGVSRDLDAEESINYEIGLRGKWEKGNYEVTLFRLDFKNQIVSTTESGGSGSSPLTNAGETLNQGIEFSADYSIGNGFTLAGNYTWLKDAKLNSTRLMNGIDRNGNRLTYAPEHLINAQFGYEAPRWNTNVGYSYVSEQFADLQNTENATANGKAGIIPSYGIWNVNARVKLNSNIDLFGSVRNLTDEKYIASRAPEGIFPGLGRMMEFGIEGRF
ncbi:MAG: TonB-dependent receptor [Sulfuricurvum sp.]|nr:TonB-dependent receptor [Sulfuricurvum sp.]